MGLDHGIMRGRALTPEEYETEPYEEYRKRRDTGKIITWRKENHFHRWFVNEVQRGIDNCEDHDFDVATLRRFVDTVRAVHAVSSLKPGVVKNGSTYTPETGWRDNLSDGQVLADEKIAQRLLPTQSGFFFGGTDYDQWYYRSLEEALEKLEPVLAEAQDGDVFHYWSSW